MTKTVLSRVSRCLLLSVLAAAALCAAWCVAASSDNNTRTAATLATSAVGKCASMNDCYTADQIVYLRVVFLPLRKSLQNTGWPVAGDFCTFQHVTCRSSGVVVNFTGAGLIGSLPRDLTVNLETAQLAATPITAMIFDNNSGITGTLTSDFGYMTQMKTFSATETGLSGTLPETWSAMTGLQVLRLSSTPVTGTLPASWSSLTHLTTVALDNTALSGTLPAEWSTLTSLQVLLVNNTQVDGSLPLEWGNLTSLIRFDAAGTKLSGTIPESWSAMKKIKTVSLAGTNITGCLPTSWTDKLGLTMTSVGLSETAACNQASKHKPWKFSWWAILIIVLGCCAVIVTVVMAVLCRRSLLPCQKHSEADSASLPTESVPRSGSGVDKHKWTPRATVNRNASTAQSGSRYAPHTAQSSSELTSPANFAVDASSCNDDTSTVFVEQNASSRRGLVLNEARRFIIIVDGETHNSPMAETDFNRDGDDDSEIATRYASDAGNGFARCPLSRHGSFLLRSGTHSTHHPTTFQTSSPDGAQLIRNPLRFT